MYVKVCGLTTAEAAVVAVEAGADAVGVVVSASSPRHLTADAARTVVAAARQAAATRPLDVVLVTAELSADEAVRSARSIGADVVQLHGSRYTADDFRTVVASGLRLWRATSLDDAPDLTVGAHGEDVLLLDAPRPGSGERWDPALLVGRTPHGQWLLAGGLDPDNVADAIAAARPWGVDVSSGVEQSRGVKDLAKVRAFVLAARAAELRGATQD